MTSVVVYYNTSPTVTLTGDNIHLEQDQFHLITYNNGNKTLAIEVYIIKYRYSILYGLSYVKR